MDKQEKSAFTVRMPMKLYKKLTDYVSEIGMSKSAFICNIVYKALEDKKEKTSRTINIR